MIHNKKHDKKKDTKQEKKHEKKHEGKDEKKQVNKQEKKIEKPSPEAKALSLFLMAYKSKSPIHKEKSKRINRLWDLVTMNKLSKSDYMKEVQDMLTSYGGYAEVVEKTVRFYIDKTGKWTLQGDDKYSLDAQQIANKILNK